MVIKYEIRETFIKVLERKNTKYILYFKKKKFMDNQIRENLYIPFFLPLFFLPFFFLLGSNVWLTVSTKEKIY